ncbi:2-amino-4-hydroxy-6-hydroxymethyldihydropteridine diphosphokinase [Streptomyces sp. 4.24]|uniref:2-amino-4-hydroxy-6- hydroxymethyldihydropteridine diphosphokinase n=1 Tax=Streptomyces tritrimontium TaxID=3406573 RepID=UPI003BB68BA4
MPFDVPSAPHPSPGHVFGALSPAVLALGSNAGHRLESLQDAVDALGDTPGLRVVGVSPVCEAGPWDGDAGMPSTRAPDAQAPDARAPYLNAVVLVWTTLAPRALLERAQAIEEALHRDRADLWGPRTIDVDLVAYGVLVHTEAGLTLPHPAAHRRARVLTPWYCLDPGAWLPGHGLVEELLAGLETVDVCPRPGLWLSPPF